MYPQTHAGLSSYVRFEYPCARCRSSLETATLNVSVMADGESEKWVLIPPPHHPLF